MDVLSEEGLFWLSLISGLPIQIKFDETKGFPLMGKYKYITAEALEAWISFKNTSC